MVIWGAIWGFVLGLTWAGGGDFQTLLGTVLGAIAGYTLRTAVRKEMQATLARTTAAREHAGRRDAAQAARAADSAVPPEAAGKTSALPAMPGDAAAQEARGPDTLPMAQEPGAATQPPLRPQSASASAAATTTPAASAPAGPGGRARPAPSGLGSTLIARAGAWLFGGNTVVRMGVLVLFIGLAFLAKYAVDNALLPPALRLALVACAGIGLFAAGLRLRGRAGDKLGYALTLQGAGVAVLYLTVFAAFRLYGFVPTAAAFGMLALVCAFSAAIAIAQNAQAMAFIGFAGAFAAPILVSTGQGNHVALFSYYALLGVAIAAIAWARAWRALNLLGFFATFGIATVWGVLRYRPEQLASTQPFLVAFFAIYLLASLFYALRHSHAPRQAVDATLVFGTPIAAFGLQAALVRDVPHATAMSSLALGALYLGLGSWLARRARGERVVNRWLAECFAALGLGFVTLAVPLALDGRWTSAVWAVEGAGVYWMGMRQARWLPRAAGMALQAMAAVLFLDALGASAGGAWPFANPQFMGAAMLAASALGIAWWSRVLPAPETGTLAGVFHTLEKPLSPVFFWVGFLWLVFAWHGEIDRRAMDASGALRHIFDAAAREHLKLVVWVTAAFAFHHLALPARANPWPIAATPAWTVMPLMLVQAVAAMALHDHAFQSGGWIAWPLAGVLHLMMLRRLDGGRPRAWWPWVHAGGVWLLVLLAGNALVFAIGKAQLWQTAWATVILLVAGTLVMLALARQRAFAAVGQPRRWPLGTFAHAYLWRAAAPLAACLAAGALLVAVLSDGDARPLPYVPLLNPTDLAVGTALAACALWLLRLRASTLAVPAWVRGKLPVGLLAALMFIAINTVWLRIAHHFGGVPWRMEALFDSFLVQAGYSILWTLIALVLMVGAHRRGLRPAWMLGAGVLAATVLKLFVIDLSNRGGSERIVVFIAVGLLMLVVGYFAPLPPAATRRTNEGATT